MAKLKAPASTVLGEVVGRRGQNTYTVRLMADGRVLDRLTISQADGTLGWSIWSSWVVRGRWSGHLLDLSPTITKWKARLRALDYTVTP